MKVTMDYGRSGLVVEIPDTPSVRLLELKPASPLPDPTASIMAAYENPIGSKSLATIARGRKDACIVVCDITRPVPNEALLNPMLQILESSGIRRERILILVATGLHRPNLGDELIEMLGPDIAKNYRIENHEGKDSPSHAFLGTSPNGVPMHLDRRYVEADLKITTGLIEPHLMAGYSGGRKVICPGIAGIETVRAWHSPRFLEHPRATAGVVEGNPVHEENTFIALKAGCDFIANVCIDGSRRITHVVAGDMIKAWEDGVRFCERQAKVAVPRPFDVVVTTSAGYPLDTTFYQSVKGLTGALPIVKEGGTIVLAAGLAEGIGGPEFQQLLRETESLASFSERIQDPNYFYMDQWQLEELAKVARHCRVKVVTDGLPASVLEDCFVEPCSSVEAAMAAALVDYGPSAEIAVIPKGPYVLPVVE